MFSSWVSQVFLKVSKVEVVWRRGMTVNCRPAKSVKDFFSLARDRRKLAWCERESEFLWKRTRMLYTPSLQIYLRPEEVRPPRTFILPSCDAKPPFLEYLKSFLPRLLFWLTLVYITYSTGIWSYTKRACDYISTSLMGLYLDIKGQQMYGPTPLPEFSKPLIYLFLAWNEFISVVLDPIKWLL